MITAEEFLKTEINIANKYSKELAHQIQSQAIKFAKLHVDAALKEASLIAREASIKYMNITHTSVISPGSILCSYPLTNIK